MKDIWETLRKYRSKPINNHTGRAVGWNEPKPARRGAGTVVEPEAKNKAKTKCPECGKSKVGLAQHMLTVHGISPENPVALSARITIDGANQRPTAAEQAEKIFHSPGVKKTKPVELPVAAKVAKPCPVCDKLFQRLGVHMSRTHGLMLMDCPYCLEEQSLKPGGRERCNACHQYFTVTEKGALAGMLILCRGCLVEFYTEKLGYQQCRSCRKYCIVDSLGQWELIS